MFDLNKLTEKQLSYLFRETVAALRNKMPLFGALTMTGHYGRWLFANKFGYQQQTDQNREFDVVGDNHYIVSSTVGEQLSGRHDFRRKISITSHHHIFIVFDEHYVVLKALKVFFHRHAQSLLVQSINLDIRIIFNEQGEVTIPGWYENGGINFHNEFLHIDYVEDITESLI